jgi:hypothetical protein
MANLKSGRFCQKGRDFSRFHGNPAAFDTIFRIILGKIKWIRRFAQAVRALREPKNFFLNHLFLCAILKTKNGCSIYREG